jgi:uncharacterized protein YprB with RNaseH-like and TPR domain
MSSGSGGGRTLAERLRALESAAHAPRRRSVTGALEEPAPRPQAFLPAGQRLVPIEHRLEEGEAGVSCVRRVELDLDRRHGTHRLGALLDLDVGALARAGRSSAVGSAEPRRMVFFDTETTSLAGGAGIYLFMIGLGFVEEDRLVVEQHFLRDVGEEAAMLARVRRTIADASAVVSFAGKSFDRPRLRDRLALCGLPVTFPDARHIDLLHPSRALWGRALPDTRLGTLERHRLGVERRDDLPGAECPAAYFDYMRGRSARLVRVFEHNLVDVLSLVTLSLEVARALTRPADRCEALASARAHERARDAAAARRVLEAALDLAAPPGVPERESSNEVRWALARRARADGEAQRALQCLAEIVATGECAAAVDAFEESARIQERDLGDVVAALVAVRRALEVAAGATGASPSGLGSIRVRELATRRARLERRVRASARA